MLPVITLKPLRLGRALVAAVTALAIALPAAPALAWGQRERDVLTGAVGALVIENVIRNSRQPKAHVLPSEYTPRALHGYDEPAYRVNRHHQRPAAAPSVYSTAAARAFNSYARHERRRIQRKLAWLGYYQGGVDGAFGPGTYAAIMAYANAEGLGGEMRATSRAYAVYDGLLY